MSQAAGAAGGKRPRGRGLPDENGWPTAIPDELDRIGSAWDMSGAMADDAGGTYVLQYEGEGTINISGANVISQKTARSRSISTAARC